MKAIDISGKRYGKLIVIKYTGNKKWLCKCDCGNTTIVYGKYLRSGLAKSCGCLKHQQNNENLLGQKFGRLIPVEYLGNSLWKCKCQCGNEVETKADYLKKGHKKSCGCIEEEKRTLTKFKDDIRSKRLYRIWKGMKDRCYREKDSSYKLYGGKGIKICDEWKDSFENFYIWSINNGYEEIDGEYKDKLSIDRIDSSKDYSPKNCRWIPISENCSRVSKTNQQLKELSKKTDDKLIQEYIERKMEMNQEIMKEKKELGNGMFFVRKNNYCILKSADGKKKYLFKSFISVSLFLNVSRGAISYRMKKKDGKLNEDWKLKKINKSEFEDFRKSNIEVIV